MHVKKAVRKLKKGESISHDSWIKDIHLKMVIGQYYLKDGKEELIGVKTIEEILNYHNDYTNERHREELKNRWIVWKNPEQNEESKKQLNNLYEQKLKIEQEIKRIESTL